MGNKQITIKIADICIGIKPLNEGWSEFCKDYIVDEEPDFIVEPTEPDIAKEQKHIAEYMDGDQYSSFEAEKLWIYRHIAEIIPAYNAFLIHASSVRVDEDAYLFLGPSGAGKTTHAILWKKYFKDRLRVINDDKPIIKVTDDEILVCGSPWSGKDRWMNNIIAPIRGMVSIHQAEENTIERITSADAWSLVLSQIHRSKEHDTMEKILSLVDSLIEAIPSYRLECKKDFEAVKIAFDALKNGSCSECER